MENSQAHQGSSTETRLGSIGQPLPRVDGVAKVTGAARYTAEHAPQHLLHCVAVGSDIPCGRVRTIDTADALGLPGVHAIITHGNAPKLKPLPDKVQGIQYSGEGGLIETLLPLQDDTVHYAGQVIALVVADTLEQATWASTRLRIDYLKGSPELDAETAEWKSEPDSYCGMEPLQLCRSPR